MAEILVMLALSPTMEQGTLTKWRVKPGDTIASGDVLCDVETDKATMEYEATSDGTILKLLMDEGGKAAVGDPIAILGEEGEDISDVLEEAKSMGGEKKEPQQEKQPEPQEQEEKPAEDTQPAPLPKPQQTETPDYTRIKASPLAKKIAQQKGIDLASVHGSGPGGRIIKEDLEHLSARPAAAMRSTVSDMTDESIPVSGKRAIIAQRLSESKFSAPHYYLKISAAVDNLINARDQLNKSIEHKISYNAFLITFAAQTIAHHPVINSSWQGDSIKKHGSIDIGLAVALNDGLITPVVRNCVNKGIMAINSELATLIDKAHDGGLTPEEYTGATFTISSLGMFGIEEFTAIINPPASSILAVGAMEKRPVVGAGDIVTVQTMMTMTLSCDHRVIDGAVGAAFLQDLKQIIEYPIQVLY